MAKAQKKQAAKGQKTAAKKVAARVKAAAKAVRKTVAPKKQTKPAPKPAAKKPAPAKKAAAQVKKAAKTVTRAVAKVAKPLKITPKKPAARPAAKATPAKPAPAKPVPAKPVPPVKAAPPAKVAPPPKVASAAKAAPPAKGALPKAAAKPAVAASPAPAARPKAPEPEKKRGRRARTRVHSNGIPVAAWLSTEKPRSASFIPAPPRAEAPSAVAAPPASSDRLIRPDDIAHPAVRTVPVRIDVEQGAGRFYVIVNPLEVVVRVGEGIEWDFRYLGGADVTVDEIAIEFDRPSPFAQPSFRTRKLGGARPHRQLSGGAIPSAAGKRVEYTVRAINAFKTEIARTRIWVTITP
jgi:hypothetical protein